MPRFVILRHELPDSSGRASHWDLMLESGPTLRTWALDQQPCLDQPISADLLSNHRPAYLDYEGPISGNRGCVVRWDHGNFEWLEQTTDRVVALLSGQRLRAKICLTPDSRTQRWLFEASVATDSANRD